MANKPQPFKFVGEAARDSLTEWRGVREIASGYGSIPSTITMPKCRVRRTAWRDAPV